MPFGTRFALNKVGLTYITNMSKVKLNFNNDYGMLRVASLVPRVNVADVPLNVRSILESIASALAQGAQLIVLPELAVTGYTCGDLLGNDALLTATERGVTEICQPPMPMPWWSWVRRCVHGDTFSTAQW